MKEKTQVRDWIPLPLEAIGVRWGIGLLSAGLRFLRWSYRNAYRGIRFAEKKGLSVERELPPFFSNIIKSSRRLATASQFDLDDFLLMTSGPAARPETVLSSIVIPVFNQADLTFQCLRSVFREVDLSRNEIVVVDDASTDATRAMLATLEGRISVIRNDVARGIVESRNAGAAAARGRYLIFLTGDSIVKPGWHEALVGTAEADERAGAVGSMLIHSHGHLREAGGIVWRDGTTAAYGALEDPNDSRFTFAREVDYCSGDSLLVRKDVFERFGGFDMRFDPSQYEDADLCMGVRAAGYKVVFQPAARAIRLDGSAARMKIQTGYESSRAIDRLKFFEKWQRELEADHLPPGEENLRAASGRKGGRRIIVFFNEIPKPLEDSGSVRLFAILRELARADRVALVYIHKRPNDPMYERQLGDLGIETVWIADWKKRFEGEQCDAAILCYPKVGNLLISEVERRFPGVKIIYDTVDLHFVRLQREYELTGEKRFAREAAQFKRIEKRLAERADQVWCVTPDDRDSLQREVPAARIEIVPNIHAMQGRGRTFAERSGLLFIGSFKHRPNRDAVEYFLDEVFPLVLEELPSLTFRVVGSNPPAEIFARGSENVSVPGFVADVAPIFESTRLFVAPLRYGSGMKGKLGQALSFGLPAVTTSIGAEGMGLSDGEEVLIADDPAEFARAVVRAYRDEELWTRLSDSGYRFIEENYSTAVVAGKISRTIDAVIETQSKLLNRGRENS